MPKMNLRAVAGVIRDAAAVVSVDTGLAHLTAALERPNVILYGPTDPGLIGAYGPGQVYLKATDYPEPEYVVSGIEPKVFLPLTAEVVWTALEGQLT
jgi:heptosyltransferase-1